MGPCEIALGDAGVTTADIQTVILVGGMTRMPAVQQKVAEFFGRRPSKEVNPDEVVAVGAAIHGAVLKVTVQEVLLLDVTPLSLGVETAGGVFTTLIPKNTTIPTRKAEVFSTAVDNQPFVNIHVLQGERPLAADNKSLANFQLLGIPPAPRGVPQIQVSFELDANGILSVSAKDLGSGKEQTVKVMPTSGLSEADIQRILEEAAAYADEDERKREFAEIKNNAETLIYTTERALEEYGSMLSEEERTQIGEDLRYCKDVSDLADVNALREALRRLEASSHRIAELMYAEALKGGGEGQT